MSYSFELAAFANVVLLWLIAMAYRYPKRGSLLLNPFGSRDPAEVSAEELREHLSSWIVWRWVVLMMGLLITLIGVALAYLSLDLFVRSSRSTGGAVSLLKLALESAAMFEIPVALWMVFSADIHVLRRMLEGREC